MSMADTLIVLDFETTGLSPRQGDRAIEIGAVKLVNGEVVDQFQELMDPGFPISAFIEDYTGITNTHLQQADCCSEVMQRFSDFIGDSNLLAHNASFDKAFLDAELERISRPYTGHFTCSLLASRRILQQAPNHRLATLIDYSNIPSQGEFHRALYDAQMTAKLWLILLSKLQQETRLSSIPFALIQKLNTTPKKSVARLLAKLAADG
ncbi:MAG: DNA polymerase III subunit epsilon [SAR86 cluster bacterium]|uniref:DNA-directed DNA polymerase n=1 Tax=SAR86 cluster bacterium TaxID=2030880 RepID=A0A2A4MNF4_9GAMM|nr:MAG: DNA polymerase III subunit epsilon [SAR86 cluster bacterium]